MAWLDRRGPWLLIAGFTVWALGFVVLYAAHALGCRSGLHQLGIGPVSVHRVLLVALFLLVVLALVALAREMYRRARGRADEAAGGMQFLRRAGLLATLAALGASIFNFAPVFGLSPCV